LNTATPFINVQPWGSTTLEPIAQVIIRPNETYAGKLPNEDAQSLVYDASNLFSVDKFSGYDRVEGGGRANVGVQATTQFDRGGAVKVLFGQSYQLFGLNSFAVQDITNTGVDSGLARSRSDYVSSVNYSPNSTYHLQRPFALRRADLERAALRSRGAGELQSLVGQQDLRQLRAAARARLPDPPRGPARLGLGQGLIELGRHRCDALGSGSQQAEPICDRRRLCRRLLRAAANYVTSYTYSAGSAPPVLGHAYTLTIGLRTLANTTSSGSATGGIQ